MRLEGYIVFSLKPEDGSRFVGAGGFAAEGFDDCFDLGDLFAVRFGEDAGSEVEVVFEADADVSAHGCRCGGEGELVAAGGEGGATVQLTGRPPAVKRSKTQGVSTAVTGRPAASRQGRANRRERCPG